MATREKILLALSGGVDSAVAALLLREAGHEVQAVYMKNWINEENVIGHCPWMQDIEDARAVCTHLGIPFEVVNFMRDYRERVVQYLVDGYARGLTPNPDVMCNREMKFGVLLDWARAHGYPAVATGHYARGAALGGATPEGPLSRPPQHPELWGTAAPALFEGVDKNKDQSYFLALLRPEQLAAARFPVGHLRKPELRALATRAGLPNAGKKDSQGICFIGEVRINDFLEKFIPDRPGPIINAEGRTLGEHRGLHRYTLGQRRGIGVPSNSDHNFYVVVGKRVEDNALLVAFEGPQTPGLWQGEIHLHQISWLVPQAPTAPLHLQAKVRYRDPSVGLTFHPEPGGSARLVFDEPQRALAIGQVCALYDGERLLGGGVYFA